MSKPGFRKSLADTKRENNAAMSYYAALSGKETPASAINVVKPKRVSGPRIAKPDDEPKEHAEQKALFQWWFSYSRTLALDHRLMVAVPNAQALYMFADNPNAFMNFLLAEGMRKGMLDLILFVPRGDYHGLLIEMKRRTKGVVSDDQRDMARIIGQQGYFCQFCYGWDDARVTVERYLEGGL